MIVAGYAVPPEVEAALVERMRVGEFDRFSLACIAVRVGCPVWASDRLAERMMQQQLKAGMVAFVRDPRRTTTWTWRTPATTPAGREG